MTRNLLITAGLIYGALSAPAFGSTLKTFTNVGPGDTGIVTISNDGGATTVSGYAGAYQGNLDGHDINDFCVDLNHDVPFGTSYLADVSHNISDASGSLSGDYYNGGLSSAIDGGYIPNYGGGFTSQQRADQVAYLIHTYGNVNSENFGNSLDLNTNLAAVNLAIWDIENDGGDGISAGKVVGDAGTQATYGGLVSDLESQALAFKDTQFLDVKWIQAPVVTANGSGFQSFGYLAPVPEAGTITIFGILLAGGALRLRSAKKKQTA